MAAGGLKRQPATVLLDSNFLFIPVKFGVDIFEELRRLLGLTRCVVPSPVIDELLLLRENSRPHMRRQVDFALTLAERCEVAELGLEPGETVDDSIVRLAKLWRCPVATNDSDLRRRLRAEKVSIIYLRNRSILEMEGFA